MTTAGVALGISVVAVVTAVVAIARGNEQEGRSDKRLRRVRECFPKLRGTKHQIQICCDDDGCTIFSLPQDISTTSNVTFANVTVTGTLTAAAFAGGALGGTSATLTGLVTAAGLVLPTPIFAQTTSLVTGVNIGTARSGTITLAPAATTFATPQIFAVTAPGVLPTSKVFLSPLGFPDQIPSIAGTRITIGAEVVSIGTNTFSVEILPSSVTGSDVTTLTDATPGSLQFLIV